MPLAPCKVASLPAHLGYVLVIETPLLREEFEAVAVAGQVAGGHHDRTVVQVALRNARLWQCVLLF